jgi:hypothetical protein
MYQHYTDGKRNTYRCLIGKKAMYRLNRKGNTWTYAQPKDLSELVECDLAQVINRGSGDKTPLYGPTPYLHLSNTLRPGEYQGTGKYSPTDKYPNGLTTTQNMKIENTLHFLKVLIKLDSFDAVTHKYMFSGTRIVKFFHKPNQKGETYKISKSYLNRRVVSKSEGVVTKAKANEVVLKSTGVWHVNTRYVGSIDTILLDGEILRFKFEHFDTDGTKSFTMTEKYTLKH